MKKNPIIDGHIDLAWNWLALNRLFEDSVELKGNKDTEETKQYEGIASVGFPEIKQGNIRIIFGTIWVETANSLHPSLGPKYDTAEESIALAKKQYDYYFDLCKKNEDISLIKDYQTVSRILSSDEFHLGIVPIIEGADFIYNLDDLNYWLDLGIKIIAPVWQRNQFGGCSELGGGITAEGKNFISNLTKFNCVIDIAHMSQQMSDTVLNESDTVIVNTHTACKHFVNDARLITDSQIRKINERNGVIGLMTWGSKLSNRPSVSLTDLINQIEHIANITGTMDNVAIGSSMDGGYGRENLPCGIDNIGALDKIGEAMLSYGFKDSDIESVLYKNWQRVLQYAYR